MRKRLFIAATCLTATVSLMAQGGPTMGWSSWNTYGVNISDALIRRQADAYRRWLFWWTQYGNWRTYHPSHTFPQRTQTRSRLHPFKGS